MKPLRRVFADELYKEMALNPKIYLLVGDLGYKIFDDHFKDFPNRCINCGASEQAMTAMAVGLSLEGKIPFVYSITSFLLYRPFETLRNYLYHERANVKLVGSGRDKDYLVDGFSHWAEEAPKILDILNIHQLHPETEEDIGPMVKMMVERDQPMFISLKR